MTDRLVLAADLRARIIAHCRSAAPKEGCGLFAAKGDRITEVYPTPNDADSSDSFVVPPAAHFAALRDAETRGWALGGSFHSHPRGVAVPSKRDVESALEPEWIYIVVGPGRTPDLRAWRITGGVAEEVALVVQPPKSG